MKRNNCYRNTDFAKSVSMSNTISERGLSKH